MQFHTQRGNLLTTVERNTVLILATAAKLTALFADLP